MNFDLECRDLVKTYGSFRAVDGISVQIPQGSFFSMLGPSGCGKTTALRLVAGFGEPTSGDILIKGKSVLKTPPNKRPVNMVFQHLALFPMMSVAENIGYGLRRRGMAREDIAKRVADILARVDLPNAGDKRIDQLSGGQKQRIAIARCMVLDPTVLLLDEPLGALDLKLREHMKVELKQLQHQFGTTFIYITHDQSEALVMSDQVAVMNQGRFEQVGSPQELYFNPKSAFVAGFVGDSNRWAGKAVSAGGQAVTVERADGGALNAVAGDNHTIAGGEAVEVFVRPEEISIEPAGATPLPGNGTNEIRGEVESFLFNGAMSRVLVKCGAGAPVSVAFAHDSGIGNFTVGQPVSLRFPPGKSRCFSQNAGRA
ncbi:ABC transporter ATP-binding protein [Labrys okinawensis]|uniref:ABC transporter ATP-binding protein n=1 Tax=Labrys okinawensis TaxID=346911 RepID=UPI0039BC38DD